MPLLHFYDRPSIEGLLTLPLDTELHALLAARLAHLRAEDLLDMTELIVVTSETTPMEVIAAIGWWPVTDPDGRHQGQPGFVQPFDYVYRASRNFHVAVQIIGNAGFAFELLVHDNADPALVALCREAPRRLPHSLRDHRNDAGGRAASGLALFVGGSLSS